PPHSHPDNQNFRTSPRPTAAFPPPSQLPLPIAHALHLRKILTIHSYETNSPPIQSSHPPSTIIIENNMIEEELVMKKGSTLRRVATLLIAGTLVVTGFAAAQNGKVEASVGKLKFVVQRE